jgi:hypothetical protein
MPQFPSRRINAAQEIIEATDRYLAGKPCGYDELAGIVLEYRRILVGALTQRPCWCERCERLVIPIDDGDDLCPHCKLVL